MSSTVANTQKHDSDQESGQDEPPEPICSDEESGERGIVFEPGSSKDFTDLFRWPQRYAETMMDSPSPDDLAAISSLLKHDIVHNESFAGTGSAGISLHMIHTAFCNQWKINYPDSDISFGILVDYLI